MPDLAANIKCGNSLIGPDFYDNKQLDLHKHLAAAKTPTDKTAIQRQIDATDRQIDRLVYELYDLTDDEIRIVEEATRPA